MIKKTNLEDWSLIKLGEKYGYVGFINEDKKVYHINSQDSELIYENFSEKKFDVGNFVKFSFYKSINKQEIRTHIKDINKCADAEALAHFPRGLAVIKNIDNDKAFFTMIGKTGIYTGRLRLEKDEYALKIGDFVNIYYYKHLLNKKILIEVLKYEKTESTSDALVKDVSGKIELKWKDDYSGWRQKTGYLPDFGFVDECYANKTLLSDHKITEECYVTGRAFYDGGGRWNVFEIQKQDNQPLQHCE